MLAAVAVIVLSSAVVAEVLSVEQARYNVDVVIGKERPEKAEWWKVMVLDPGSSSLSLLVA